MPSGGPSKEELEYYYKNSKKYFDELAKYYYEADRAYYDKFIAPYYSSFGTAFSGSSQSSRGPVRSLVIVASLVMLALGFAVFLIMQGTQDAEYDNRKSTEDAPKKTQRQTEPEKKPSVTDYQKGLDYYNDKDYDNAGKYFKRVTKDDENYDDAQKKIEEIEALEKPESDNKSSRGRYTKPKPVERIR